MLKFVLIFFLVMYGIYKIGSFFVKTLFGGFRMNQNHQTRGRSQQKRYPEGSIHVDKVPKKGKTSNKSSFDGGEYVEYEEVR